MGHGRTHGGVIGSETPEEIVVRAAPETAAVRRLARRAGESGVTVHQDQPNAMRAKEQRSTALHTGFLGSGASVIRVGWSTVSGQMRDNLCLCNSTRSLAIRFNTRAQRAPRSYPSPPLSAKPSPSSHEAR